MSPVTTEADGAPSKPPPATCEKGQVKSSEVVMLGDSYMDRNYGNVGANIIADAQKASALPAGTNYREYFLAGAQKICCGSSFTPTAEAPTCTGNAPGLQCTYVDTRPAFMGTPEPPASPVPTTS